MLTSTSTMQKKKSLKKKEFLKEIST